MRPNSHRHLPERRGGALRPPRTVPTAMWRGVAAPPRTLGLAPCLGLYTLPAAEAQVTASGAEDKAVLLELKAAADTSECIGIGLSTLEDPASRKPELSCLSFRDLIDLRSIDADCSR